MISNENTINRCSTYKQRIDPLRLSIIVPTYNEAPNICEFLSRIEESLGTSGWEVIFVDDDSKDGTASIVRSIGQKDTRVRCLHRIGKRGLSSACIEGMLASAAPNIAVMDADLQHDETILPQMLCELEQDRADLVIGSRYAPGGSTGEWTSKRKILSRFATILSRTALPCQVSDPMSGFFMLQRKVLHSTIHSLSGLGFKILLDILASSKNENFRVIELPFKFRDRFAGESKLDKYVIWEHCMLLADKTIGQVIPLRFFFFLAIIAFGIFAHITFFIFLFTIINYNFYFSHISASLLTIFSFFIANSILTYRHEKNSGNKWIKHLLIFIAICSVGMTANIIFSSYLFSNDINWLISTIAGSHISSFWNYISISIFREYYL